MKKKHSTLFWLAAGGAAFWLYRRHQMAQMHTAAALAAGTHPATRQIADAAIFTQGGLNLPLTNVTPAGT